MKWIKLLWEKIVFIYRRIKEQDDYNTLMRMREHTQRNIEMLRNRYDSFPDKRKSVPRKILTTIRSEEWKLSSINNELKYYGK